MKTILYRLLPFRQLILLSFLLLFSAVKSYSQTLEWEKVIGRPGVTEKSDASAKIHSNLYVFGGYYYPNYPGAPMGAHFVFTNANGDTLYTKIFFQYTA
ncbi:MAG: hypothetical protein LPJ89_06050, partial [Hymenobacteraceae bacterium]|nr:hypothetical protein [Hymenobacteraceae bacterium]